MTSVDDPEKHFLGNLLEDDPGSTSATGSRVVGMNAPIPSASPIAPPVTNVGAIMPPIGSMSGSWPEPPPPYSPPLEPWASNVNTTLLGSTAVPTQNWFPFTDRKEASTTDFLSSYNISGSSTPITPSTPTRVPHFPSSQVHHYHHNLHHHTHTHNVVQNHYFGAPPPGLENLAPRAAPAAASVSPALEASSWDYTGLENINMSTSSVSFSDWKKENMSQASPESTAVSESSVSSHSVNQEIAYTHPPLSPSEVVEVAKEKKQISRSYADHLSKSNSATPKRGGSAIGAEKKQKQELAKKTSNQLPLENVATRIVVKGQPHSAPVVSRMPFSYRDVAARLENPPSSIPQHLDESQREKKEETTTSDLRAIDSRAVASKNKGNLHGAGTTANSSEKNENNKKNRVDNEFQKINSRKNKKEKSSSAVPAPLIYEGVHPVDASSRYDVLKNLESPTQHRNDKKAANGRPPLIQKIFSRSSSPAEDMIDTEEDDGQRTRSASTPANQNNGQKKDQRKRTVQATQRRRKGRKEEPTWLEKAWRTFVELCCFIWEHISFSLQWTFILIVEVCQRIADLFISSGRSMWITACRTIQSVFLIFLCTMYHIFIAIKGFFVSTLAFLNMIASDDDEVTEKLSWGLKKEIPIPTVATEFADRLSRETVRDAYSALGLRSDCSDDDIKRNYKRLAALVSPDKCNCDGADEIFELVTMALAAIGNKESRSEYTVENSKNNEYHSKIVTIWNKLAKIIEDARNTIFCDCDETHFRIATRIRPSEARFCKRCGVNHPAKHSDIWVDKGILGINPTYYTCTDNVVYNITSWATCKSQKGMLKNMRAYTHHVQYRLLSPMSNDYDNQSSQYFNSPLNYPTSSTDARFLSDLQEEYSSLLRQRSLAQISFKTCEPREEDRSRRAANRRQKRWR
ncbi:hypothetical protein L5515_013765 [Caenorhabditis briggsae]|uniref:J domain-containing protein n=1 Tax=Caenorhabditis briggsae TaxID=6238 RepID=A0AAE9EB87_CAEBR|nr:hypothetical protein L5515_013765 [Caenorhabditis briggsae]